MVDTLPDDAATAAKNGEQQPLVLDPRQLVRIEAVHRGFLYQHIYVTNCMLRAGPAGVERIVVEGDEDVELQLADQRIYVQVKSRKDTLTRSDIAGALARFAEIRTQHAIGARPGAAKFVITANVPPAPGLSDEYNSSTWPRDVALHWPDGPTERYPALPTPASDVVAALDYCNALAENLPFAMLRPDTLAWKLTGLAMLAASGTPPRQDHSFHRSELPDLFEQLVLQMQDFPAPPPIYRPQIGEPPLSTDKRIRIVSGLSGAGKTAWVAEAATHSASPAIYIDVVEMPGPALASAVAREVGGKLFGGGRGTFGEIMLPGASGLDALGLLSSRIGQQGLTVDVVIDNAQRLDPSDLKPIVERGANIRFLFLTQPGAATEQLAALLDVRPESLGGWDEDTIAAAAHDGGCIADFPACERLSRLTGGMPFYVANAVAVTGREYQGSITDFCSSIEMQTNIVGTAQEIILKRAFDTLSPAQKDAVAVLSQADVPLSRDEASALLERACGLAPRAAAAELRRLPEGGNVELFSNAGIKIHDAIRPLGRLHLADRGEEVEKRAREHLRDVIIESIQRDWSIGKVALLVRVMGLLGEGQILVDFATDEIFHEMGLWAEIEPFLGAIADDLAALPETRFWALDGIVFNDLREGKPERAHVGIGRMRDLLDREELGVDEWMAWGTKRMLALSIDGDSDGVTAMLEDVEARLPKSGAHRRIFRYNRAVAMFKLDVPQVAIAETEELIAEYYGLLGLTPTDVFARNPDAIRPLLPRGRDNSDDLKHLADALDLLAQSVQRIGGMAPLVRFHAIKFYELASAPQSIIRVGQDLIEEFCAHNDFVGARDVIEKNLLPTVQGMGLTSWVVPVRSQYAVILAFCGEFDAAEREMQRLEPYEAGLSPAGRGELQSQRRLIAQIRRDGPPPQIEIEIPPEMQAFLAERNADLESTEPMFEVGRNTRCPCGSGERYKHCHGR